MHEIRQTKLVKKPVRQIKIELCVCGGELNQESHKKFTYTLYRYSKILLKRAIKYMTKWLRTDNLSQGIVMETSSPFRPLPPPCPTTTARPSSSPWRPPAHRSARSSPAEARGSRQRRPRTRRGRRSASKLSLAYVLKYIWKQKYCTSLIMCTLEFRREKDRKS